MTAEQSPAWQEVGWTDQDGRAGHAYEALQPVRCHTCLRMIRPGERFSRPRLSPRHDVRLCLCQACSSIEDESRANHLFPTYLPLRLDDSSPPI